MLFRVFKACALWPPEGGSTLYSIWMVFFILTVCIIFPISQIVCVFWVDSVNAAVQNLLISSTITMVVIKGMNVLANQKTFLEFFHVLSELDSTVTPDEYEKIFKKIFFVSDSLLNLFCFNYNVSYVFLAIQVIVSDPADKLWASTYLYPIDFLHQRTIYLGGIIYQAVSNLAIIYISMCVDTYPASLLHILGGHVEVLGLRMQALGKNSDDIQDIQHGEKDLIKLCKEYLLIIRFGKQFVSL